MYGVGKHVHSARKPAAGFFVKGNLLGHGLAPFSYGSFLVVQGVLSLTPLEC
jgi:hypothetical protein